MASDISSTVRDRHQGRLMQRAFAAACSLSFVLPIIVWLLIRTAGDAWWVATSLLYGPRWLLMLPSLALLPVAIFCRRRRLVWFLVASIAVTLGPLMGLQLNLWNRPSPSPTDARPLRLLSCNVAGTRVNWSLLIDQIAKERPDVVLLQECANPAQIATVFPPIEWHVADAGGLLTASRHPILATGTLTNSQGWRTIAAFHQLRLLDQDIWISNVHLDTPRRGLELLRAGDLSAAAHLIEQESQSRYQESQRVRQQLDLLPRWVAVAGDFNFVTESRIYRHQWSDLTNAFEMAGFGYGYSKQTRLWSVRIDHVLTPSSSRIYSAHVGENVGSDHLPLIVELAIPR